MIRFGPMVNRNLIAMAIAAAMLVSVIGMLVLAFFGKAIPDTIQATATTALGALSGALIFKEQNGTGSGG